MILLFRSLAFLFLSFSFISLVDASPALLEEAVGVRAGHFSPGQLEAHYYKHRHEFGSITQDEYLQGAQTLLNTSPDRDVLGKRRGNGDVLRFRVSTGEFAVMARTGRIKTYFKTDYGYWMRQ